MATARPVVATNCNGIPKLIQHNVNGLIVPTDCESALYDAVRACVQSEELRSRLAFAGRETIEQNFCFDRRMKKVVDVYRGLSSMLAAMIQPPTHRDKPKQKTVGRDSSPVLI